MRLKLTGSGVSCAVAYVHRKALSEKLAKIEGDGESIEAWVFENASFFFIVSRGLMTETAKISFEHAGDTTDMQHEPQSPYSVDWSAVLPDSHPGYMASLDEDAGFDEIVREYRILTEEGRRAPFENEDALVIYTEFESGEASFDFGDTDKLPEDLCFYEYDMYEYDPSDADSNDFVRRVTYEQGIVGTDDVDLALNEIFANGERLPVHVTATGETKSRVWRWVFDPEAAEHCLDFFGSKEIPIRGNELTITKIIAQ